jgi:hypothetical protein
MNPLSPCPVASKNHTDVLGKTATEQGHNVRGHLPRLAGSNVTSPPAAHPPTPGGDVTTTSSPTDYGPRSP